MHLKHFWLKYALFSILYYIDINKNILYRYLKYIFYVSNHEKICITLY